VLFEWETENTVRLSTGIVIGCVQMVRFSVLNEEEARKSELNHHVNGFLPDTDTHLCDFELFSVAFCCSLMRWLVRKC
jgi:hypothetical protein